MRIDIDHLTLPEPESVMLLKAEVRRLEGVIAALADQDATISVCEGKIIVTMDATLTDEEREAVNQAAIRVEALCQRGSKHMAATLRGLLERMT